MSGLKSILKKDLERVYITASAIILFGAILRLFYIDIMPVIPKIIMLAAFLTGSVVFGVYAVLSISAGCRRLSLGIEAFPLVVLMALCYTW